MIKNKYIKQVLWFLFSLISYFWLLVLFSQNIAYIIYSIFYQNLYLLIIIIFIFFLIFFFIGKYLLAFKDSSKNYLKTIYNILSITRGILFYYFILYILLSFIFIFFDFKNYYIYDFFKELLFTILHIIWAILLLSTIFKLNILNINLKIPLLYKIFYALPFILLVAISFYYFSTFSTIQSIYSKEAYYKYLDSKEKMAILYDEKFEDKLWSSFYTNITNLSIWNFQYKEPLIHLPWKWIDFDFTLYYNTSNIYNWPVWNTWNFENNTMLVRVSDWNFAIHTWFGSAFMLYKKDLNYYKSDVIDMELKYIDWEYVLKINETWAIYKFTDDRINPILRLNKIIDKKWNTMEYSYNSLWQIYSIKDTLNNRLWKNNILFEYYEHSRIKQVTDYNWNVIKFYYYTEDSGNWLLYDLKLLEVYKNDKKIRTIKYTYYTKWILKHFIHEISDPYVNYYLENKYDEGWRLIYYKTRLWIRYYSYTFYENSWKIKTNHVIERWWNNVIYTIDENWMIINRENMSWDKSMDSKFVYDDNSNLIKSIKPLWNWYIYNNDEKWKLISKILKEDVLSDSNEWLNFKFLYLDGNKIPYAIELSSWEKIQIDENYSWSKFLYYDDLLEKHTKEIINTVDNLWNFKYFDINNKRYKVNYSIDWKIIWYTNLNWANKEDKLYLNNNDEYDLVYDKRNYITTKNFKDTNLKYKYINYYYNINDNLVRLEYEWWKNVNFEYDWYWRLIKVIDIHWNYIILNYNEWFDIKGIKIYDFDNNIVR